MKPKKNKGLEEFIEHAMSVEDDLVQRGQIHGDTKGIIIIDEFDTFDHSPETIAALLNLNGPTMKIEGTPADRANHLLDMFNKLENPDETKED